LDIVAHRMADPDSVLQPILATPADERLVGLSPDGRWMAYVSNESGRFQVYVRSTDSARDERWVVLGTDRAGVNMPHWSRDGRTIRYVAADTMFAVSVAPGPTFAMTGLRALFKLPPGFSRYDVFPDGSMLMIRERAARSELMMVDDWRALLPR
jgi:hypothetical protein